MTKRAFGPAAAAVAFAFAAFSIAADPVITAHPRLLLSAAEKSRLTTKKNANDPSWQALKARADTLAGYAIFPYKAATRNSAPDNTIFYDYQGEGWYDAALPLAFAYQMTSDTKYSNKLIELAQEMIRAQADPDNAGLSPIRPDNYYPARAVTAVLAFIYDYCYDQLSASLKSQIVTLMNDYFDDASVNGYQAQIYSYASDGNFFGGHLYGVALMGYASFGDNPRAQEMIEWARIRFDGTRGPTVPNSKVPEGWRSQSFDGGQKPLVALEDPGPNITGNPFKSGFDFQGWSYGSEEFSRMIDYMLVVKSATGEDLLSQHLSWLSLILRAEKHALLPNRFMIDPAGDWGGYQGAVVSRALPTRLAYALAGSADGPAAEHFAYSEIVPSTNPDLTVYPPPEWADFYFGNATRASTELILPPYYTGFAPNYPQGAHSPGGTNGAIPYFIMRSDRGPTATWASVHMGSAYWDDHQHFAAGHMFIARGGDHLLVSATDWKTEVDSSGNPIYGRSGVLGTSLQARKSSLNNTLYFDDLGDYQLAGDALVGGQSLLGIDEVVADELNQDFSYVRSDLSTAYDRSGDPADTPNRRLDFFYRSFLYLRAANIFVVYDQVQAKPSSNPQGAYRKQMRWHFPERPAMSGRLARVEHGQSRLFVDTVLPANASITVVDEWRNPDPCGADNEGCNAATFRIEVKDPQNPLFVPFLTVLQPGSSSSTAPSTTQIASLDNKMIGVDVTQSTGARSIALFNNQSGQVPPPITSTSYNFNGSSAVTHTLMGVTPGARYSVTLTSGVVQVAQNATGNVTASAAGVLFYTVSGTSGPCVTGGKQLCLSNSRYRVTMNARTPSGQAGDGDNAVLQSSVFGYFSLPTLTADPSNPEVFVKIVEPAAGRPWVFYAGLTNLDYTVTVSDNAGSAINKSYHVDASPAGSFQSFGNYDVDGSTSPKCDDVIVSASTTTPGSCSSNGTTLCLKNRFAVTLFAENNPTRGTESTNGAAVHVNDTFGFFATPPLTDANDLQAFVKAIDGRPINNKFWIFLGGLTDLRLTFTVTDTQTGQRKTYVKPAASTCGWNDTSAF